MADEGVRHVGCGALATWKAAVDDQGGSVLLIWCPTCGMALAEEEMDGEVEDMPPFPKDELAVAVLLAEAESRGVKGSAKVN